MEYLSNVIMLSKFVNVILTVKMLICRLVRAGIVASGFRRRTALLMAHRISSSQSSHREFDDIKCREQVGFGWNGERNYADLPCYPFPSVRYKALTSELQALKEKERGDWKLLCIEEKKQLYRANFRQTFAEFQAPSGDWGSCILWAAIFICIGVWMYIFTVVFVYEKRPDSYKYENKMAQLRRQIDLRVNPVTGVASRWDYDKEEWKDGLWFKPPNPFKNCDGERIENQYK